MADTEKKVKRLYIVRSDENCRLVNAISGAAALRHVVKPVYTVLPAKAADVATILTAGGVVEQAEDDDPTNALAKTVKPPIPPLLAPNPADPRN